MNNKLLLQDLTDQLAEAGKIKKKDAEEFLRAFFKISEDALFEDGIVKINGLGTLKLVLVDARKSVNVTTGEEFEIKEHYKVSFVPDADLKNAVNQPYAHLEPVELDPVVESPVVKEKASSAKEKISANQDKGSSSSNEKSKPERVSAPKEPKEPKERRKTKFSTLGWVAFFVLIAAFGAWSWISNIKHNREEAARSKEIAMIDSLEADANLQADLAALEDENQSDSLHSKAEEDSLEAAIQSVANEPGTTKPAAQEPASKTAATKVIANETKPKTVAAEPASKTAAKPVAQPTKPTVATKTVAQPVKEEPKVINTTKSKSTKPSDTKAKESLPKPSVEHIATVTLQPGDRLNLLSLKYYGDKIFWVYIYEANKSVIPKPDRVPAGITIRIPKPDPKLIDPKNEALVAKAKALQLKYIGAQ